MSFLHRLYRWLYIRTKGHYPFGTLVRYRPPVGPTGFAWDFPGLEYDSVGLVVGCWSSYRHPLPPDMLIKGSIVLINGKPHNLENWSLEVIDETG